MQPRSSAAAFHEVPPDQVLFFRYLDVEIFDAAATGPMLFDLLVCGPAAGHACAAAFLLLT